MEYLATSAEAIALSIEEWFDKYGVAILKREEEAIASFGKFYPKTLRAFGGPKGLRKWLVSAPSVGMSTRVGRVFRAENDRVLTRLGLYDWDVISPVSRRAKEFDELGHTELMGVICGALP